MTAQELAQQLDSAPPSSARSDATVLRHSSFSLSVQRWAHPHPLVSPLYMERMSVRKQLAWQQTPNTNEAYFFTIMHTEIMHSDKGSGPRVQARHLGTLVVKLRTPSFEVENVMCRSSVRLAFCENPYLVWESHPSARRSCLFRISLLRQRCFGL